MHGRCSVECEMDNDRQPWARLDRETVKAYGAFRVYLELGRRRTVDAAQQAATGGKERGNRPRGKGPRIWEEWAARYFWRERARAWDEEQDRIAEDARTRALAVEAEKWALRESRHREEAWKLHEELIEKAREMLKWPLQTQHVTLDKDGQTQHVTVNPARWSMEHVARYVETADKIARLALGLATERVEASGPNGRPIEVKQAPELDLTKLSTDELEDLQRLLGKADPG
jgi:hypothetical protein